MAFTTTIIEQGHRNYVIQVVGTGADAAATLVDVSTLVPPCQRLRLQRVSYDVAPAGSVDLTWQGDAQPFLTMSEGPGQTMCYKKVGGLPNRNPASNGNVLITSAAATKYSITLHFIKSQPVIPL